VLNRLGGVNKFVCTYMLCVRRGGVDVSVLGCVLLAVFV
jgi:hypothetical protein